MIVEFTNYGSDCSYVRNYYSVNFPDINLKAKEDIFLIDFESFLKVGSLLYSENKENYAGLKEIYGITFTIVSITHKYNKDKGGHILLVVIKES